MGTELVERLVELLGDGMVAAEELAERAGVTVRDIRAAVQTDGRFAPIGDSYVYTPALLDGTVWCTPVDPADASGESSDGTRMDGTPHEVPGGYLRTEPYLSPLSWWLVTDPVPRVDGDGHEIDRLRCAGIWIDEGDRDVVHGSADWLDGIGPWASFSVTDVGIRVDPLDQPPAPDAAQAAAVRAAYDEVVEQREAVGSDGGEPSPRFASLTPLLDTAIARDPAAFRAVPIAPVPELLTAAGLELRDSLVAEAGFDWGELRRWQNRNRLRTYNGLNDDQIDGLMLMVGACELFGERGDDALGGTDEERIGALTLFAGLLADADVGNAFLEETQRRGVDLHDLERFADRILAEVGGTELDLAGVAWLLATCYEATARFTDAIRVIDGSVGDDTTHPLALIDAASIAADRSQPARTRQLLARAGVTGPDDTGMFPEQAERLLGEIQPFVGRRQRSDVKRNDPCPCGSGRKYKQCHLGKETLTLDERAPWLYEKACRFTRLHAADVLIDVAMDLAEYAPEFEDSLIELPFVMDVVLHEYDGWSEFVDGRGELLPADERALAETWSTVPRAVYAVESMRGRGTGELRLRNVATDEIVVVSGVQLDERIDDDQYFVGRPLPVGDTHRSMSGFFPITAERAEDAIAAIASGETGLLIDLLAEELAPD